MNVAPRVNAGVAPRVNPGVTPRINPGVAPRVNAGVNPRINNPRVNPPRVTTPTPRANAGIRPNAGVNPRETLRPILPGGDIRSNVNRGLRPNVPGVDGRVRGNVDGRARLDNFLNPRANARLGVGANIGQRHRPSWFNPNVYTRSRINANLGRTLSNVIGTRVVDGRFDARIRPDRLQHWGRYATGVHRYWHNHRHPYFHSHWWTGRHVYRPFGYFNYIGYRPWGYWWTTPGWVGLSRWYTDWGWNSPYYYDYGPGGNVVFRDNYVFVDGTNVGTTEEYAQSAAALAAVDPSQVPSQRAEDWLALGTFAVVEATDGQADAQDMLEPKRYVQLAVDKNGFVAGTYYKKDTDEVFAVSGRVDKDTQRLAFSFDTNRDIVFETGIFNLTQEQTPVLVYLGPNKSDTFVFVRLEKPEGAEDEGPAPAGAQQLP